MRSASPSSSITNNTALSTLSNVRSLPQQLRARDQQDDKPWREASVLLPLHLSLARLSGPAQLFSAIRRNHMRQEDADARQNKNTDYSKLDHRTHRVAWPCLDVGTDRVISAFISCVQEKLRTISARGAGAVFYISGCDGIRLIISSCSQDDAPEPSGNTRVSIAVHIGLLDICWTPWPADELSH